jgi:hypothetical protein
VVKRPFVSDGRLMMAQDTHTFLSADVYWKVLRFLTTSKWYMLHCLEVSCRFPMPTERRQQMQQEGIASTILRGTGVVNIPALCAVDGGGVTGKTILLLLGAHNRRVRCKFHYILSLCLGKVATKQKSSLTLLIFGHFRR